MELALLLLLILLLFAFLNWLHNLTTPDDNREPYLRDEFGNVWALYVAGPVGDVPNHEAFIHDGTPHQNPAVNTYTRCSLVSDYSTLGGTRGALVSDYPQRNSF